MTPLISCITGMLTLAAAVAIGQKKTYGWYIASVSQCFWTWLIVLTEAWGLFISELPLAAVFLYNAYRWRREGQL